MASHEKSDHASWPPLTLRYITVGGSIRRRQWLELLWLGVDIPMRQKVDRRERQIQENQTDSGWSKNECIPEEIARDSSESMRSMPLPPRLEHSCGWRVLCPSPVDRKNGVQHIKID